MVPRRDNGPRTLQPPSWSPNPSCPPDEYHRSLVKALAKSLASGAYPLVIADAPHPRWAGALPARAAQVLCVPAHARAQRAARRPHQRCRRR